MYVRRWGVTFMSDCEVTLQRRTYMRSSLQQSSYVGNSSVEGLNPLALTYHFGRAGTDITEDTPQPPGSNQVGNEERMESVEASFRDSDTKSGRWEGDARILEATKQPSRREEGVLGEN